MLVYIDLNVKWDFIKINQENACFIIIYIDHVIVHVNNVMVHLTESVKLVLKNIS